MGAVQNINQTEAGVPSEDQTFPTLDTQEKKCYDILAIDKVLWGNSSIPAGSLF